MDWTLLVSSPVRKEEIRDLVVPGRLNCPTLLALAGLFGVDSSIHFSREELVGLTVLEEAGSLQTRCIFIMSHLRKLLCPASETAIEALTAAGDESPVESEKDKRFEPGLPLLVPPVGSVWSVLRSEG